MATTTPKIERTCLCCDAVFLGTPKATRCQPCRTEGRKVPAATYRYRKCIECDSSFRIEQEGMHRCQPCADLLGLDRYELTEAQLEAIREEQRKERWAAQLQQQNDWLSRREKTPKGYRKMNPRTMKTPVGILWLQLCHADGAAASVMHATDSTLSEDQKVFLLTTYYRLRAKGYHPSALATLCPQALLEGVTDSDISDMPEVDLEDAHGDDFDPLEGLSDAARADILEFRQRRDREEAMMALGIAV